MEKLLEKIPKDLAIQLGNYLSSGIEPGRLMCAILSNDLMAAAREAEQDQYAAVAITAKYLVDRADRLSYGSRARVERWIAGFKTEIPLSNTGCEIW